VASKEPKRFNSVRSVNKHTSLNTGWPLKRKTWKSQGTAK